MANTHLQQKHRNVLLAACSVLSVMLLSSPSWAQVETPLISVTVNSPSDGLPSPDAELTLREAIELTNGTLSISDLSSAEQQLVNARAARAEIQFDLPNDQSSADQSSAEPIVIELNDVLPAINQPGLTIDGTTQPGYDAMRSATAEIFIPIPVVTIRPAEGREVFRGLTVAADDVTIRGLNLYGFNANSQITHATPPANIFISHREIPLNRETEVPFAGDRSSAPPEGIVIEHNWLGLTTDGEMPPIASSFGISVFDSTGAKISRNRISYHNGSGIITGRQADDLEIVENILVGNGLSGMPDAIRMDGSVENGFISSNLICGNDGSGIFLFKPDGAVSIINNDIRFNGQRLRRAAVYLMGSGHRVIENNITNQKGSGVAVTAYGRGPNAQSIGNVITGNRFSRLEGLSIDLNARRDRTPQAFQRGDGPNPQRNSRKRRQDTGNGAVNAPEFDSSEFFVIDGSAIVRGKADANSEIHLYRVGSQTSESHGPLNEPVSMTTAGEDGHFEFVLESAEAGAVFSAIATDPLYGTSEPALNTSIRSLDEPSFDGSIAVSEAAHLPQCTTSPTPPAPPEPPAPTDIPNLPDVTRLEVPRNVHFGLDQDFVSVDSEPVLNRIANVLKQYPNIVVDLHGHTDSRASDAYNRDLARRRAENTRRYLIRKGIGSERMTIRSFGETELRVEETDVVSFARNRRVEFVFSDVQGAEITFFNQEDDLQIEP